MKKILFLLCSLVASLICSALPCGVTAKAEAEDYVAESYLIEISKTESMLPVPNIPETWTYSITLKNGEAVLGEGVSKYAFTQTGDYTLVYEIHRNGSLTDVLTETTTLRVADVNKPVVITADGYDEEYFVGDELTIQTAQVEDDVDTNLTATVALYFGEEKVSLQGDKYVFEKAGEYTLVYTAVDSYGNEGTLTYKMSVSEKPRSGCAGIGCGSALGGASMLGVVMVACASMLMKKKQK